MRCFNYDQNKALSSASTTSFVDIPHLDSDGEELDYTLGGDHSSFDGELLCDSISDTINAYMVNVFSPSVADSTSAVPAVQHFSISSTFLQGNGSSFSAEQRLSNCVVDSGCSTHMVPSDTVLYNETAISTSVRFGVSSSRATSVGDAKILTSLGEEIVIKQAIKVEGLSVFVLSFHKLCSDGFIPYLTKNGGFIFKGNSLLGNVVVKDGIYYLETGRLTTSEQGYDALVADVKPDSSAALWHYRLGHLNRKDMQRSTDLAQGVVVKPSEKLDLCEPCCAAESTRKPFLNEGRKAHFPFEFI